MKDALLAYAHYLAIFALVATLAAELILFRPTMPPALFRRLQIVDRWYGISAGLVVASGLGRLFWGAQGQAFLTHNPVFWTKMALFVLVALLSIAPTVFFVRSRSHAAAVDSISFGAETFSRMRTFIRAQVLLLLLIPLCASLMARGL
jgi:putative membrane protein